MSLYAIGDLHLHFQSDLKAKAQLRDRAWRNHEQKVQKYCAELIQPDDTLVLVGDHSWGRNLDESAQDLQFIADLPGRKILLRGNHDMFWDAKKTQMLNARYARKLLFLQDNFFPYEDYALVGTKGHCFEGPFYLNRRGQIVGWDEEKAEHAKKLVERELERLRVSFEAARAAGYRKYILFLHYPPTNILEDDSPFTAMAEEYGAEQVIYAHSHGESRFHDSILGEKNGIRYGTMVPFMKTMRQKHGKKYKSATADAGYERFSNYLYLEANVQLSFIKPANYEQQKSSGFKKQIGRMENMFYDAEDNSYTCAQGRKLSLRRECTELQNGRYVTTAWYRCESCSGCPVRDKCCQAKNAEQAKELRLNKTLQEMKRDKGRLRTHLSEISVA